jgi:hypothetical protein
VKHPSLDGGKVSLLACLRKQGRAVCEKVHDLRGLNAILELNGFHVRASERAMVSFRLVRIMHLALSLQRNRSLLLLLLLLPPTFYSL